MAVRAHARVRFARLHANTTVLPLPSVCLRSSIVPFRRERAGTGAVGMEHAPRLVAVGADICLLLSHVFLPPRRPLR